MRTLFWSAGLERLDPDPCPGPTALPDTGTGINLFFGCRCFRTPNSVPTCWLLLLRGSCARLSSPSPSPRWSAGGAPPNGTPTALVASCCFAGDAGGFPGVGAVTACTALFRSSRAERPPVRRKPDPSPAAGARLTLGLPVAGSGGISKGFSAAAPTPGMRSSVVGGGLLGAGIAAFAASPGSALPACTHVSFSCDWIIIASFPVCNLLLASL